MSKDSNHIDYQSLLKDYIRKTMDESGSNDKNINNSFLFLENSTLHMIIVYILMQLEQQTGKDNNHIEVNSAMMDEIIDSLDTMIEDNKSAFEELVNMVKEKA